MFGQSEKNKKQKNKKNKRKNKKKQNKTKQNKTKQNKTKKTEHSPQQKQQSMHSFGNQDLHFFFVVSLILYCLVLSVFDIVWFCIVFCVVLFGVILNYFYDLFC